MARVILHIDFNSYFATVEQQANPRLRGKPIGVTGGDRMERTVIGAASIEAKKYGVKTGMHLFEARRLCPNLILVRGDSDKYLECTKRFLNILKSYTPYVEVFSIDECFLCLDSSIDNAVWMAIDIKRRIRAEVGEWISCSIGVSYNKLLAKLAGSLFKPNGLVVIADQQSAQMVLDQIELDEVCGIGGGLKKRLNNMGIFDFKTLRKATLEQLVAAFKEHQGNVLYNYARGIDNSPITPFYEKEEVKSVGHRHTLSFDTDDINKIKQILYKLTELVARRLRAKKLVGKTVHCWYRSSFNLASHLKGVRLNFEGNGMQTTINFTSSGLEIFSAALRSFLSLWQGQKIRMIAVSVSYLKPATPKNLSLLDEDKREEVIIRAIDNVNNKYGEFTLQRAVLLSSEKVNRKPNPFLADRRFKL